METRANYVAVGAFVTVCLLGLVIASLWLAGEQYRQEYTYYQTFFPGPVTGLGNGTVVRYNGIDFGRVSNLAFDPADPKRVIVTMQADPAIKLHQDSVASLEAQGITGGVYVEITGGTASAPLIATKPGERYPVIQSKPSTLQELTQAGPELVGHFNAVGERLEDVLNDKNRAAIATVLKHLDETMATINSHSEALGQSLENLKTVTADMSRTLSNVDKTLSGADDTLTVVNKTVGSFQAAANATTATVDKLGKLSDDTDRVVNGTVVAQFTQLLAESRSLVASLNRLSNDLERNPSRLIFGDQRQGYAPQ
jgi:phospholipid/cholesterol/gamma-HCH transport system substrate-binding protein